MESADRIVAFAGQVALWALPVLSAVILHEIAHGYVALRLGDDTAQRMGRLTLNPLPHIDPLGTVLLPGLLLFVGSPFVFGYARPVPVNYARLGDPRRDMVLVALAGPVTNLILATACAFLLHQLIGGLDPSTAGTTASAVVTIAAYAVVINVVLAVFNMLPIPPLDGGRVLTGLLPPGPARALAALEPFGFLILIALMMTDSLRVVLGAPVRFLVEMLL